MGRPSKYKEYVEPYLEDIKKWVRAGATVEEVADALDVNPRTLIEYKKKYPALDAVFTRGRVAVVCDIKAALLKKALGFHYEETRNSIKKGEDGEEKVYTEIYKRYCPPSETAAAMMLRNIDPTYSDQDNAVVKLRQQEAELRKKIAEADKWIEGDE